MAVGRNGNFGRGAAVALALLVLASGCTGPELEADAEPGSPQIAAQRTEGTAEERLSMQKAAVPISVRDWSI